MAFMQQDSLGEEFINIHQPVGRGKSANSPQDVLVVQALLAIVYNEHPFFRRRRPTKGPAVVSSKLERDTPTLIAHFQRVHLKRSAPQGFVNKAPSTAKAEQTSTLIHLFSICDTVQSSVLLSEERVPDRLKREHPSLRGLVLLNETVISPREERQTRVIDSSR